MDGLGMYIVGAGLVAARGWCGACCRGVGLALALLACPALGGAGLAPALGEL